MAIYSNERDPNEVNWEKKDYIFYIDRKITMWVREEHSIQATSQEEANEKMIEAFKNDYYDDSFIDQEYLYDTLKELSPEDNSGEATAELFTEDLDDLANNKTEENKIF